MQSPPQVPYAAYKSKKHSRTSSNPHLVSNSSSPPPKSRPVSLIVSSPPVLPNWRDVPSDHGAPEDVSDHPPRPRPSSAASSFPPGESSVPRVNGHASSSILPSKEESSTSPSPSPAQDIKPESTETPIAGPSVPSNPSTSTLTTDLRPPVQHVPVTRKSSSFRHIPLRHATARSPLQSSPLRPASSHSRAPSWASIESASQPDSQPNDARPLVTSTSSPVPVTPQERMLHTIPSIETLAQPIPSRPEPQHSGLSLVAPPRSSSLPPKPARQNPSPSLSIATTPAVSPAPSSKSLPPPPTPTSASASTSKPPTPSPKPSAPYRPGFQPKGVYRPRTDEFIDIRRVKRDIGRIERTRLERRLEKLIQLHFHDDPHHSARPGPLPIPGNKRASSFFELDISDLRKIGTGDLWKGVLQSQASQSGKVDVRGAEQKITPWQDDASVSQCPLCSTAFHPLTNRKHHCRLCGQIICSLPPKVPQRPVPCSLLFVVSDGRIEEVSEGVDYGVRRKGSISETKKVNGAGDEEKFLKGVRICRQCRPVLLRQQLQKEMAQVPAFAKLYEAFVTLEKDIEDTLPQFQELLVSLSHNDQPTKEASTIRKRLLDGFAQYDVLAKRIRKLPCKPGSSQDRVQLAVQTRANLFLQKNMLPLQSLSRPKVKAQSTPSGINSLETQTQYVDPDSELARTLQPLLEQEALLETFVGEATAHRKFEDAKALKTNLKEIRSEIERILSSSESGVSRDRGKGPIKNGK